MSFDPAEAATERLAALQLSPDKAADSGRAVQSLDSVREAEPQATERSAGRISSGPAVGGLGQAKEALRRLIGASALASISDSKIRHLVIA